MFCRNCGRDIGDARYCPICGAEQVETEREKEVRNLEYRLSEASFTGGQFGQFNGSVSTMYRSIFGDIKMLVLAILMTASSVLMLFGEKSTYLNTSVNISGVSLPVFQILFSIALWLIYAGAKGQGQYKTTGFAMASGTLKGMYILIWVLIVFIAVAILLTFLFGDTIVENIEELIPKDLLNEFDMEFKINGAALATTAGLSVSPDSSYGRVAVAGISIILVIAMIFIILFNIFCVKRLHRFAKSVCTSLANDTPQFVSVGAAKAWLIVLAVFSFLGALAVGSGSGSTAVTAFLASACQGAAAILASIIIGKNFTSNYM